ncbi:MAG: hypothetical protein JSS77_07115, partial [Acidobacteria bacterium]|nr:hypothetical protein [Acidobacteriota bacterium]
MLKLRFESDMKIKGHADMVAYRIEDYRAKIAEGRTRSDKDTVATLLKISGLMTAALLELVATEVLQAIAKVLPADKMSDGFELWHVLCTKYSLSEEKVLEDAQFEKLALGIIRDSMAWNRRSPLSEFLQGLQLQIDRLRVAKKCTDDAVEVVQALVLRAVLESTAASGPKYQSVHQSFYSQQAKATTIGAVSLAAFYAEVRAIDVAAAMS